MKWVEEGIEEEGSNPLDPQLLLGSSDEANDFFYSPLNRWHNMTVSRTHRAEGLKAETDEATAVRTIKDLNMVTGMMTGWEN